MRSIYTGRAAALLSTALLAGLAGVSACGDKNAQQGGASAREIQLAPSTAAQPQLNDAPQPAAAPAPAPDKPAPKRPQVAKTPTPQQKPPQPVVVVRPLSASDSAAAAPAPAPAPAPAVVAAAPSGPPAIPTGIVDVGTTFPVHPLARVCTNTFKPGDRFTATLDQTVAGSNGATLPAGSTVVLRVDAANRSMNSSDSLRLSFSVVSVRVGDQSYDLTGRVSQTAPLEKVRVQTTGDQAKKVGVGAALGALAGQLLGHNTRSTVLGGAVGAAAGAAVAAGTTDYDGCVPTNADLAVTLDAPLRIRLQPN
jgi:hypothetical protein